MEIVYFIVFIAACAGLVMWATGKSEKRNSAEKALKNRVKVRQDQSELLTTPANYLLANRGEIWQKKRMHVTEDVIATNRFVPKSVSAGEPEYDGFSRRDRHHVVVGTAHIKKEDHVDEPRMAPVPYKKGQAAS
jgi:hypothetical protein